MHRHIGRLFQQGYSCKNNWVLNDPHCSGKIWPEIAHLEHKLTSRFYEPHHNSGDACRQRCRSRIKQVVPFAPGDQHPSQGESEKNETTLHEAIIIRAGKTYLDDLDAI